MKMQLPLHGNEYQFVSTRLLTVHLSLIASKSFTFVPQAIVDDRDECSRGVYPRLREYRASISMSVDLHSFTETNSCKVSLS